MSDPFLGEIKVFGFSFPPRGYMLCQGQQLTVSQNTALFSLLSTYYGGDGVQSFKLPDLRSRTAVGQGQGLGLSPYQIGQSTGTETTTLLLSNMPVHTHQVNYVAPVYTPPTYSAPTAATTINAYTQPTARQISPANAFLTAGQDANGVPVNGYSNAGTAATLASGAATTTLSGGGISGGGVTSGSVQLGTAGASTPFSNLQPLLAINYSIAIQGIYPSRN